MKNWLSRRSLRTWHERMYDPPQKLAVPRLINLYDNPQERIEETLGESSPVTRAWVTHGMFGELAKFKATFAKDPPVPMGSSNPYEPVRVK